MKLLCQHCLGDSACANKAIVLCCLNLISWSLACGSTSHQEVNTTDRISGCKKPNLQFVIVTEQKTRLSPQQNRPHAHWQCSSVTQQSTHGWSLSSHLKTMPDAMPSLTKLLSTRRICHTCLLWDHKKPGSEVRHCLCLCSSALRCLILLDRRITILLYDTCCTYNVVLLRYTVMYLISVLAV